MTEISVSQNDTTVVDKQGELIVLQMPESINHQIMGKGTMV